MTAHIHVDGKEYELTDVTQVNLTHTEASGGTMVTLKTQGNQLLGYLNVGPGCFVTVGNPPTKVGTTHIPEIEPIKLASPKGRG